MDSENGHENSFGLSVVLECQNDTILTFKVIFLCQKLNPWEFFSLKNIKKGDQLLLLTCLDNIDF